MPPRARPGRRTHVEGALHPEDLTALREQCATLGIPPDRWGRVPALARLWETVAAVRLARRIQEREGAGEDRALYLASARLGLSGDTVRSRLRRFFLDAYDEGA